MTGSLSEFVKTADKRASGCKLCHITPADKLQEIADSKGVIGAVLIQRWLRSEGIEIGISTISRHMERCCD